MATKPANEIIKDILMDAEKPTEKEEKSAEKVTIKMTEAQIDEEAKKWGKELSKQEKVRIKIKSHGKNDLDDVPVGINGYVYQIKKDVYVEVPESVAKILEEADYI